MEQIRTSRALGAAIRGERTRQRLSQQALAARAGISRETVVALEKGQAGNLATLFSVLAALDIALATADVSGDSLDLDRLFSETEEL